MNHLALTSKNQLIFNSDTFSHFRCRDSSRGKVPCQEENRKELVSGHIARLPSAGDALAAATKPHRSSLGRGAPGRLAANRRASRSRKRSTRDRTEPFLLIPAGNCRGNGSPTDNLHQSATSWNPAYSLHQSISSQLCVTLSRLAHIL